MATIDEFISYAQGKVFDANGKVNMVSVPQWYSPFAGQCVSLCQGYMKYFGCTVTSRGNAVDWWRNFNSNGLSAYFTKSSSPSNGAIVVTNSDPTYGHVGVYYNGQMLQQNVNNSPYARLDRIYGTPYGYLIPNFLNENKYEEKDLVPEHAYATLTQSVNKRRDAPNGLVVETLPAGKKLEYTAKWVGNGHRYISWVEIEPNGNHYRYFVAVSGSEVQGQDAWATFEPITASDTKTDDGNKSDSNNTGTTLDLTEEHGYAKYKVDSVAIRKGSPTGDKAGVVNSGYVMEYDHKYVGNGHRYIVYQKEGTYYFIACSPTEARSTEWADFYSEDPRKETDSNNGNDNGSSTVDEGEVEEPNLADEVLKTTDIKLTVALVDKDKYQYKCPYVMKKPKYVIIHNAGTNGDPSAQNLNRSMNNKEYKSWHFSVDESGTYEGLPLNRNNFSVGDGATGDGNRNGIAIEICRDMESSDDVANRAEQNGALLAALLLKKYGLTVKDGLKKHQDFKMTDGTYKYCPHRIIDNGWDEFVKKVESYLNPKDDDSTNDNNDSDSSEEKVDTGLVNSVLQLILKLLQKLFKRIS